MRSRFEPHGTFDVCQMGRILRVEGTGPWNLESMRSSAKEAQSIVAALQGQPWAVLVVLHGESIFVPAAANMLIETVQREKTLGRCATAVLVNDCTSPNFAQMHMADIYDAASEHFQFFDDIHLATAWLHQQIAEFSE